jgi:hypothetical protein
VFKLPAACDTRTIRRDAAGCWLCPSGHRPGRHGGSIVAFGHTKVPPLRKLRVDWATRRNCAVVLEGAVSMTLSCPGHGIAAQNDTVPSGGKYP